MDHADEPAGTEPPPELHSLPPGYRSVRELARRPGVVVLEALRGSKRVALRLVSGTEPEEVLAELAVLAAVEHPGLAKLAAHGRLPDGRGTFVAREWIDGEPVDAWAEGATPEQIARAMIGLGPGLAHLHERGFVHGDLKPENVLVRANGTPVLTDFGLAREVDSAAQARGVSGSLVAIAPEVLRGAPPTPRSDIFALGVMLHGLLAERSIDATRFYGRFPAQPFFQAAESSVEELPDWSREWLTRVLSRDPARRPEHVVDAVRDLARKLGVESGVEGRIRLALQPGDVWASFVADRLESGIASAPEWWRTRRSDDADSLLRFASIQASLRAIPSVSVDLAGDLDGHEHALALDDWVRGTLEAAAGGVVWVANACATGWPARALEGLVGGGGTTRVIAVGGPSTPPGFGEQTVPAVSESAVSALLQRKLESETEGRVETLAERLHAECGGSLATLGELLDELVSEGWILAGDTRSRLRPGALPDWLGRRRGHGDKRRVDDLNASERAVLAAIALLGGSASMRLAQDTSGESEAAFGRAVESACRNQLATVERSATGLEVTTRLKLQSLDIEHESLREIHARAAHALEALGATRQRVLVHRYRADPTEDVRLAVLDHARRLSELSAPELALEMLDDVGAEAEADPRFRAEYGRAWAAMGEVDRALAVVATLEADPSRAVQALARGLEGDTLLRQRRFAEAVACFVRATELAPSDCADAVHARALVLYETRQDGELQRLLAEIEAGRHGSLREGQELNVRALVAMSRSRAGEVEAACAALTRMLDGVSELTAKDPAAGRVAEFVFHTNLGNIARTRGDASTSAEHFALAERAAVQGGNLLGVAQARTLLGAALRDLGRLHEAEAPLLSALGIRERTGDATGAAAVRSIVGWLHLERGHPRAAVHELERGAGDLESAGRAVDAALLRALAAEARSRIGESPALEAQTDRYDHDPRIGNALARAARAQGDLEGARRFAAAARESAERLGRLGVAAEAAFLAGTVPTLPAHASPSLAQDVRILDLLRVPGPEFDVRGARALGAELEASGRDDRAARLYIAIAARADDGAARERGLALLAGCCSGLTDSEAHFLQTCLLGLPDPWPADLAVLAPQPDKDWDMDVLAVLEINQRLVEQQDLPTLLGAIVEHALEVTGAERGFLALEEDGELSLDLAFDSRRGDIEAPEVEVSHSILAQALEGGKALRISNAVEDPELGAAVSVKALDLRSILVQPFAVQDGVRGAIYVDNRVRAGAFDERAEKLLGLMAGQAALAIRQVRRLDEIRTLNGKLGRQVVEKESGLEVARRALAEVGLASPVEGLVGQAPAMRAVHALLHRVAGSDLAVLVTGESGTGKELAARALHDLSPWKDGPFVSENCAALPPSLIESELFGFRKGAFTGADRDQPGLFERASEGTLFLDEIGELPLELQAKLLRVLETHEVRRLGESDSRPAKFRLVAATNRDLAAMSDEGTFRADLRYRLDGVCVTMPTIAQRVEDIPLLVDHFLRLEAAKGGPRRTCSPEVLRELCQRDWPGNVRELANEVARLCLLSEGDLIDPALVRTSMVRRDAAPLGPGTLADLERRAIEEALERAGGDKRKAAELLGISRAKIYQRLKEWRVDEGEG